jgi:hypothetical protein
MRAVADMIACACRLRPSRGGRCLQWWSAKTNSGPLDGGDAMTTKSHFAKRTPARSQEAMPRRQSHISQNELGAQSPSVAGCGSRVAFRKTSPRGSMPSVAGCGSRVAFRKTSPWGSMPSVAGCGSGVAFRNSGSASDPLRSRRHARKKRGRICKSFVFSNSALRSVRRRASGAAERTTRQATSRIFTAASRSTETSCETPRSAMVTP